MTSNTPKATPIGEGTLLIFGGTTEGRLAIDVCEQAGKPFYYSTKGSTQDVEMHNGVRLTGAMSANEIQTFCDTHNIRCIIDAAHPYAEELHRAIATTNVPVIRLVRDTVQYSGCLYCNSFDDAISKMEAAGIERLIAFSGANTISKLKPFWQKHPTVFRILNRPESIAIAERNGFPSDSLIFYKDTKILPTIEEETSLLKSIKECHPSVDSWAMITKDSGSNGGFEAKVTAALNLGIKVFVVKRPVQAHWYSATGRHTLRRAIEHIVPDFFPLKTGLTTGACATAAAKAALLSLLYDEQPEEVHFALPDGEIMSIPVLHAGNGTATVVKPDNDDPDVTKGCHITASVALNNSGKITFLQGEGVGRVTLPGLGIPVGEPAINPTPRRTIAEEIRALSKCGYDVTINVENGRELAKRTFNNKVGVVDGISIIGTSGIVHPLSNEAFIQSIRRELEVAKASGCETIGLVSGMKSERAIGGRCVHYGNFIGEALKACHELGFPNVIVGIMIGKAVKLAEGHLDTHSHKVAMNKDFLCSLAPDYADKISQITMARQLWDFMPQSFFDTVRQKCLAHCRSVFPNDALPHSPEKERELSIVLIKD